MPVCNHCNAHVSEQFAKVFAEADGTIMACPDCAANAGIAVTARERSR